MKFLINSSRICIVCSAVEWQNWCGGMYVALLFLSAN